MLRLFGSEEIQSETSRVFTFQGQTKSKLMEEEDEDAEVAVVAAVAAEEEAVRQQEVRKLMTPPRFLLQITPAARQHQTTSYVGRVGKRAIGLRHARLSGFISPPKTMRRSILAQSRTRVSFNLPHSGPLLMLGRTQITCICQRSRGDRTHCCC